MAILECKSGQDARSDLRPAAAAVPRAWRVLDAGRALDSGTRPVACSPRREPPRHLRSWYLLLFYLLFFAASGWCQEPDSLDGAAGQAVNLSRNEQWRQKREQRLGEIRPMKQGRLERLMLWVEERGMNFEYKGVTPGIANFPSGSGFSPQLRFWFPRIFDSPVDVQATAAYSFRNYQMYRFQVGRVLALDPQELVAEGDTGGLSKFRGLSRRPSDFFLYADIGYYYYPEEDFFGIGPDSKQEERSNYLLESGAYTAAVGFRVNPWLVLGGGAGLVQLSLRSGKDDRFPSTEDVVYSAPVPGLEQAPDYYRYLTAAFVDYRDTPGNAHKGGFFGFQILRVDDKGGNEFEFTRYMFDARQYVPLGSPQRVLALWFLTNFDDPDPGSEVPFYLMRTLGGGNTLRGFREFRFRDRNRMHLSAEYRWEASPVLEFALFYDTGKVFSDSDDFNFGHLEDSIGFGARFKTGGSTAMRVEVADSDEATRYSWRFSASF